MEWTIFGIYAAIPLVLAGVIWALVLARPRTDAVTARLILIERIKAGGSDPARIPPAAMDEIIARCIRGVRSWKSSGATDFETEEVAFINRLNHEAALIVEILEGRWTGGRTYRVLQEHHAFCPPDEATPA